MYVDADGNVDFGDVDEYVLYDNDEVTAAFLAWREVRAGKVTGSAAIAASEKFKGFAFAPDDISRTYNVAASSDLAFMMARTGDVPTMTIEDPNGEMIDESTTRADVAYDETTSTVQDEDGNDVVTTQVTYAVDNAIAGDWVVHLHGVDEGDTDQTYIFTLIGAGLAPSLGNVNVVSTGDTTADVSWTLTNDAAPTVNIYATLGPTETTRSPAVDPTQTDHAAGVRRRAPAPGHRLDVRRDGQHPDHRPERPGERRVLHPRGSRRREESEAAPVLDG